MMFDRKAPGGGVDIECIPENGKMLLTWKFKFTGERTEAFVSVTVKDREGNQVLECLRSEPEEELLMAVLLHPRLWQGVGNPYLYRMEAALFDQQGRLLDRIISPLPLRRLEKHPDKGYFLNGVEFMPRTVGYELPHVPVQPKDQGKIFQDLEMIIQLGANSIYCREIAGNIEMLRGLCDRLGLLMWHEEPEVCLRGAGQCLLNAATDNPLPLYYQYKALWSSQPFVHIMPESVTAVGGGYYNAMVYSNCEKVALYTDGVLFEVHSGEREFFFEGIPAKRPCIMLTAEADGCTVSLSIQKSYVRAGLR